MRKIKKGDEVIVVAGASKGRRGTVLNVASDGERVLVEGVNMVKKHTKANPNAGIQGGIIEQERPVHISNVNIFNPSTGAGDRVGVRALEDGRRVRFFKSNNEVVDV
jgi:large subunit ribosomal protein L24